MDYIGHNAEDEDEEDSVESGVETSMSREERFNSFIESFNSNLESLHTLFEKIPENSGNSISKQNRESKNYDSPTFGYSEIDFETFGLFLFDVFKTCDLDTNNEQISFVGIGCGTGKVVFSAYMMNIFNRCAGIEILPDLHKSCMSTLRNYIKHFLGSVNDQVNIDFLLGDATYIDWSGYDVAFIYASAFNRQMMIRISDIANKMRPGNVVITVSHK